MISLKVKEMVKAVDGKILQGDPEQKFSNLTIDSRRVKPGDIFLAIIGENHDGHNFISEAVDNGAKVIITSRTIKPYSGTAIILVRDTTKALQDLAHYIRNSLTNIHVVGITGSAGKTTTKDMLASILEKNKKIIKSPGNYNNDYGLPLTLLELDGDEEVAILEMAMRHKGDIARLAEIAEPDIGIITNIGAAHLENLKTVENVAMAKEELLEGLTSEGFAALNYDDEYIRDMISKFPELEIDLISLENENVDFYVDSIDVVKEGEETKFTIYHEESSYEVIMNRVGRHNIYNALSAVAVAKKLGISWDDIKLGLQDIQVTGLRQEIRKMDGIKIINDTYNANPLSMKAGIDSLKAMDSNRRIAVLGAMLELGPIEDAAHKEIGKYLHRQNIDVLVAVGEIGETIAQGAAMAGMPEQNIYIYQNNEDAASFLNKVMTSGDTILVKGSRALGMEEIVDLLLEYGG
ncbi:MAG: UDP-N-acetylmuramoyl-tripeptide--D-alanyl-D-alanine ligase [Bacillota bacterium]